MANLKLIIILILSGTLSSCAVFESRDFYDEMVFADLDEPLIIPGQDFEVVTGDEGRTYRSVDEIYRRTPATLMEKESIRYSASIKSELYNLENGQSESEYYQYLKIRDEFSTDSERIYFLRLSARERRQYLEARGILSHSGKKMTNNDDPSNFRMPQISGAITIGMDQDNVLNTWGRPVRKDVSGDPQLRNERWSYQVGGRVKYVYFESGIVQGWSEQ